MARFNLFLFLISMGLMGLPAQQAGAQIPADGLQLWFKADALSGTHGATVDQWPDSSGSNRNANQAVNALKPLYVTNAIGGKPAIRFDGSDDVLSVDDSPVWAFTNFTFFVVLKKTVSSASWWLNAWLAQDPGAGSFNKWIWSSSVGDVVWHINRPGTGSAELHGNTATLLTTNVYLLEMRKTGSIYDFFRNGAADGVRTNALAVPDCSAALTIGRAEGGSMQGDIAEIVVYNRSLGEAERQQAGDYLALKYGLSSAYVPSSTQTLAIISAQGGCSPAPGAYLYATGSVIACSVTNPVMTSGSTQSVCTGWTLAGNVPSAGSGTNVSITLTNAATLTWQWTSRCQWTCTPSGSGSISGSSNGWYSGGATASVTAIPDSGYYFAGWSGQTGGCTIAGSTLAAPMTEARSVTALFTSSSTDLGLGVRVGAGERAIPGTPVTYLVSVSNYGPLSVSGAIVSNRLPSVMAFCPSGSSPGWTWSNGAVCYQIGSMANGAVSSATLRVFLSPGAPADAVLTNTLTVFSLDTASDLALSNNTASALRTVQWPRWIYDFESLAFANITGQDGWNKLATYDGVVTAGTGVNTSKVLKSGTANNVAYPYRGNDASYAMHTYQGNETGAVYQCDFMYSSTYSGGGLTIEATNSAGTVYAGPGFGSSYTLFNAIGKSCSIPSGCDSGDWIRFRLVIDFTAANGQGSGTLFYRNLTDGAPGFTAVLVQTNMGILTSMSANGCPPPTWKRARFRFDYDLFRADNIQAGEADLQLAASASAGLVTLGDTVTYTFVVTNRGPTPALDVCLTHQLPEGFSFVSASASQGIVTQEAGFVRGFLDTLTNGLSATVQVTALATASGQMTNSALVMSMTDFDPDLSNNLVRIDTVASAANVPDLVLSGYAQPASPLTTNRSVLLRLAVTNLSATAATGCVVTSTPPVGLAFLSSTSSQGTCLYTGQTVVCNLGLVPGHGSAWLEIRLTNLVAGVFTNAARVSSAEPDAFPSDNAAGIVFAVSKATQSISFPAIPAQEAANSVWLGAAASSGLPVSYAIVAGPGILTLTNRLSFSGTGLVHVAASQPGNADYLAAPAVTNTCLAGNAVAAVFLTGLNQAYDGSARPVTATTAPTGLTVQVTYNGHPGAPSNAGSYVVTGLVSDAIYQGLAVETLVIGKGTQIIAFPNPGPQTVTSTVRLAATASSGLIPAFLVTAGPGQIAGTSNLTFTGTGTVSVAASVAGDGNWNSASVTNTFAVGKALAGLSLWGGHQQWDGTPKGAGDYETDPPGLMVDFTYNGSSVAPSNVGVYAVTGTVNDLLYEGIGTATMEIVRGEQFIYFEEPGIQLLTNRLQLTAEVSSGLPPAFAVESGPGLITGSNVLSFSGTGTVVLTVSQPGNANVMPAVTVTSVVPVVYVSRPGGNRYGLLGCGWRQSIALRRDGKVVVWGNNAYGQLAVPQPNERFKAVATGDSHCLALREDGSIAAWGNNGDGACNVPAPNSNFVAVAAGDRHSIGLKADGTIVTWGFNYYGQVTGASGATNCVAIAGSSQTTLALTADGQIRTGGWRWRCRPTGRSRPWPGVTSTGWP